MRPLILTLSLLPACLLRPVPSDGTSSTTDASSATTSTTTDIPTTTTTTDLLTTSTTTATPDPLPTSTADTTDPVDFIIKPDGGTGPTSECQGLKQLDPECPPGQKCTINGALSVTHCVDVARDPKGLYEPCTMQGDGWSGQDDCDLGMLCWDVDERGQGVCIGLCDDADADDSCVCVDPKAMPTFCQECAVGLCLPGCDPLIQDCPGTDLCIPDADRFICVLDASGDEGQTNDPCEFANACDKGLVCLSTGLASSACMQGSQGCCQPFCELFTMGPCPNPDQECLPWFDEMLPIPAGHEDVGICAIPE